MLSKTKWARKNISRDLERLFGLNSSLRWWTVYYYWIYLSLIINERWEFWFSGKTPAGILLITIEWSILTWLQSALHPYSPASLSIPALSLMLSPVLQATQNTVLLLHWSRFPEKLRQVPQMPLQNTGSPPSPVCHQQAHHVAPTTSTVSFISFVLSPLDHECLENGSWEDGLVYSWVPLYAGWEGVSYPSKQGELPQCQVKYCKESSYSKLNVRLAQAGALCYEVNFLKYIHFNG